MTGAEIIALARTHFGEATALTLTDAQFGEFLNIAKQDLYERLPPDRLKNLVSVAAVVLTAGKGDIPVTHDKVIGAYLDGVPGAMVPLPVIQNMDYGTFFSPAVPVFTVNEKNIWVRPITAGCEVEFVAPPSEYDHATQSANEINDIPEQFHRSLSLLMASLAYAQEEDAAQSEIYRGVYLQSLSSAMARDSEGS